MITTLSKAIKHAEKLSVPLTKRNDYALLLNTEILDMMKIRKVFVKQWQRTRRHDYKATDNRLSKQIRNAINEIRNMNWAAKLSQIKPNNRDLKKRNKFLQKSFMHWLLNFHHTYTKIH